MTVFRRGAIGSRPTFCAALTLSLIAVLLMAGTSPSIYGQAPPAEEGAAADKAGADPAPPANPAAKPPTEPKSTIAWVLESSGWIGALILLLSIYFVATVVRLFVELRPEVVMPPAIMEECRALMEKRDYQGVYNVVKENNSFFSLLITAGMAELSNGVNAAREAMDRVGEMLVVQMEKKISMLAVLGTLGPMIGLLGTLKGMIASFSVIALSDTQLKSSEVAKGISEALILTFEGVLLSVPAIYFFAVFRNRVSTLSATAMLEADEFIRRMASTAKGKPVTTTGPAAKTE